MTDDRRELDELRERCARLEAAIEAVQRDAAAMSRELLQALEAQRLALEQSADAREALAGIRASGAGRAAAAWSSWRRRLTGMVAARRRRAARRAALARRGRSFQPIAAAPLGANVAGYLNAESGMGEAARCTIRALQAAGIPVALNNVRAPQRMADATFQAFSVDHPHPFNIVHLNAENMEAFAEARGAAYFDRRYTIGFWFWELEEFRPDWADAFAYVDEVWVASEHTRRSVGRNAPVPVVHLPPGLPDPAPGAFGRAHFDLPDRTFVFLYTFDVSSQMERKNPLGAVRAFRAAGFAPDDAVLVLKFTNAHANRAALRDLADAAAGAHVRFLDGVIDRPELAALMRESDACVSLHRAEGLGLTIAEHMALGRPAIATAYSGNLDFMTPDVACLVPVTPTAIATDYGPYLRGYRWAEPDLDAAAAAMRRLVDSPDYARDLGARGAAHVRRVLSLERSSALMKSRLDQVRSGTVRVSGIAPPAGTLEPIYT